MVNKSNEKYSPNNTVIILLYCKYCTRIFLRVSLFLTKYQRYPVYFKYYLKFK